MKNFLINKKKIINIGINIVVILLFFATVMPFFITTKYALFVTDDFPIVNAVISKYDGSYFRTGIKCAASYWHDYNGNWFSFTIAYWLHPLVHGGQSALVTALRIQLSLVIIGSVYFCYSLTVFFDLQIGKIFRIIALTVIPLLWFKEYFDLYLWWLTSCTYLMPLYLFLFGFGTYLLALKSNKIWQYIISGLLLFCMSGGSLNVVGMGCYVLLFTLVGWNTYIKKLCVPSLIVFATTLIGACVTAFAPGNFARQSGQETEKIGALKAIFKEIQIIGVECKWLVFHTAFIALVLLALVWGSMLSRKKITVVNLLVASMACIALPVVTMFPVVLGYGNIDYKDISNRGYCLMDISLFFGACFMAVMWGIYLKDFIKGNVKRIISFIILLIACVDVLLCGQKVSELVPVQIATNLKSGYNEIFFDTWMEIYSICENCETSDVVIEMSVPPRKAGCSWAKLGESPDKWWNEVVSIYYGIDSVSLKNTYEQK